MENVPSVVTLYLKMLQKDCTSRKIIDTPSYCPSVICITNTFEEECPYNVDDWNKLFLGFAGYVKGNKRRK